MVNDKFAPVNDPLLQLNLKTAYTPAGGLRNPSRDPASAVNNFDLPEEFKIKEDKKDAAAYKQYVSDRIKKIGGASVGQSGAQMYIGPAAAIRSYKKKIDLYDSLQKQFDEASTSARAQQQAGVNQLDAYIDQYKKDPGGVDLTPGFMLADMMQKGMGIDSSMAYTYAQSGMRPETDTTRKANIMKLEQASSRLKSDIAKTTTQDFATRMKAVAERPDLLDAEMMLAKADYMRAQGSGKGGRGLPEKSSTELSNFDNALRELKTLSQELQSNSTLLGPVMGQIATWNPYDVPSQKIDSFLRRVAQNVGKALEGGVLRKEDEQKYRRMLPKLTDTYEVATYKLRGILDSMQSKRNLYLDALTKSGFDTSRFALADVNITADGQVSQVDAEGLELKKGLVLDGMEFIGDPNKAGAGDDPKNWRPVS